MLNITLLQVDREPQTTHPLTEEPRFGVILLPKSCVQYKNDAAPLHAGHPLLLVLRATGLIETGP